MLIIGAKGFAKEVLEVFVQMGKTDNIAFYDDVNDLGDLLYGQFPVLKNERQVRDFFSMHGSEFTIGIGNPKYRYIMCKKFEAWGGQLTSSISPYCHIGKFGNTISDGANLMTGTVITSDVSIGKGCLVNLNCTIGHDSIIGNFVELCPGVHISGNCTIGRLVFVGTNATILPNINIGENAVIGAGAVVTRDVPADSMVVGSPAKVVRELPKIDYL